MLPDTLPCIVIRFVFSSGTRPWYNGATDENRLLISYSNNYPLAEALHDAK